MVHTGDIVWKVREEYGDVREQERSVRKLWVCSFVIVKWGGIGKNKKELQVIMDGIIA